VPIDQIGLLLTDDGLASGWAERLERAGIQFEVCS
jgi:hypothetical protein